MHENIDLTGTDHMNFRFLLAAERMLGSHWLHSAERADQEAQ